jgi:hypothetical protein
MLSSRSVADGEHFSRAARQWKSDSVGGFIRREPVGIHQMVVTVIKRYPLSRINVRAISNCDSRCQSETATRYSMARRPRSEHELFNAPVQQGAESEKVSKQIDEELRVRLIRVLFSTPGGLTSDCRRRQIG